MARSVFGTIGALNVERERLEAILRGMVEGVLVIDLAGIVVLMNSRARELLGLYVDTPWRGRQLVEFVRDPRLADVLRDLGAGASVTSRDVVLEASGTASPGTTLGFVVTRRGGCQEQLIERARHQHAGIDDHRVLVGARRVLVDLLHFRRRQQAHDRGQRVGTLARGKAHHAHEDQDAEHGCAAAPIPA
jgi:nitrogen fixation/metabolism regulation signal transduction histidine kinase